MSRKGYSRAYEREWSEAETRRLIASWKDGVSTDEIAQRHGRSRGAITTRIAELRLCDPSIPFRKPAGRRH